MIQSDMRTIKVITEDEYGYQLGLAGPVTIYLRKHPKMEVPKLGTQVEVTYEWGSALRAANC